MSSEFELALNGATNFVRDNLPKIAKEILAWQKEGLLVEGKLKEAAELINFGGALRSIKMVEDLAKDMALERMAELVPPPPSCRCCGSTENLHEDWGSGGPYRCSDPDCIVF